MTAAMSSGCPQRASDCPGGTMPSSRSGRPASKSGVRMIPGQTEFTRIPFGPSSTAADCVRLITAAFAAE